MWKKLKVFLSYNHEDYEAAKDLKEYLEFSGLDVFLAHKDIEPTREWQEEIHKNLKACDIFIPLLTDNFRTSKWTDQEVGIAYAHEKKFIPLIIDIVPHGFMSKWQGLRVSPYFKKDSSIRKSEAKEILRQVNNMFPERMRESVFASLAEIDSFKKANAIFAFLDMNEPFTNEEINAIIKESIENSQIIMGWGAKGKLILWIDKYRDKIRPELLSKIREIIPERKVEEKGESLVQGLKDGL